MSDVCGIYLIRNTVNGKVYVGQSSHIQRRWREHKKAAKAGHKSYLYDSMRKHGIDCFELVLLEKCAFDVLDEREAYWMELHCCHDEAKGYNYRPAGQRKQAMTEAARASISSRLKGRKLPPEQVEQMRQRAIGRACPDSAKEKLREFHTGIALSESEREAIKKQIAAIHHKRDKCEKGRVVKTDAYKTEQFRNACRERFLGKPKSEETRAKMRERMKNEDPEVRARRLAALSAVTKARWKKWRIERELQCN